MSVATAAMAERPEQLDWKPIILTGYRVWVERFNQYEIVSRDGQNHLYFVGSSLCVELLANATLQDCKNAAEAHLLKCQNYIASEVSIE